MQIAAIAHEDAVDVIVPLADIQAFPKLWDQGWRGRIDGLPCKDWGCLPNDLLLERAGEVLEHLKAGKKVGVCCMGGHGRTGYFAAAVLGLAGVKDPIAWLRENYCKSAVESVGQIESLAEALNNPELKEHKPKQRASAWSDSSWEGTGYVYSGKKCPDCAHYVGPTEKCPDSGVVAGEKLSACRWFKGKEGDINTDTQAASQEGIDAAEEDDELLCCDCVYANLSGEKTDCTMGLAAAKYYDDCAGFELWEGGAME